MYGDHPDLTLRQHSFPTRRSSDLGDGIVCIGAGGGGRAGTVSHLAFVPIVRSMFDGTIVLAGAVSTGAVIRAAEILGADLAYIGTRFIATQEAMAPEDYKTMLVEGGVTDVIYTSTVKGMPASWRSEEHASELQS